MIDFAGIENTKVSESGQWMPPGFDGVVKVTATKDYLHEQKGMMFIVNFEIVESNLDACKEGATFGWIQKMGQNRKMALRNIKTWAFAVMGLAADDEKGNSHIQTMLSNAVGAETRDGKKNVFLGQEVGLRTYTKMVGKEKNKPFTMHQWAPISEDA